MKKTLAAKSPPPRRSQEERTAEARRRILDAAEDCFARYGFQRSSMALIARKAGVSRALLHYHFENQEKLSLAVWDQVAAGIFERIVSQPPVAADAEQWVSELADKLFMELRHRSGLVAVAVDVALRAGEKPRARRRFREHLDSHAHLIQRGIELLIPGHLRPLPIEPQTIADMIMIVCAGVAALTPMLDDLQGDAQSQGRTDAAVAAFKHLFMAQLFGRQTQAHAA